MRKQMRGFFQKVVKSANSESDVVTLSVRISGLSVLKTTR